MSILQMQSSFWPEAAYLGRVKSCVRSSTLLHSIGSGQDPWPYAGRMQAGTGRSICTNLSDVNSDAFRVLGRM